MSKVINDFIHRYEKEYDFYQNLSQNVENKIKDYLSRAGVRAIVSSRAKSISRLDVKLEDRNKKKNYKNVSEIYDDIVDLSGVRVALYFPGDIRLVEDIISKNFKVHKVKKFPESLNKKIIGNYTKVFDGYSAAHFRASLNDDSRYGKDHCVEIQVASVLMHAWSEVEHDLVYKPLQGELSNEELMILDEINGLVLSGNIALERLQRAGLHRVNDESNLKFLNHYDFASYILSKIKIDEDVFDFKTVFNIFKLAGINTRDAISRVIDKVSEIKDKVQVRNKKSPLMMEGVFIEAMACLFPSESIRMALKTEYDNDDNIKLIVKLLTCAISYKDETGSVGRIIKYVSLMPFEFEIYERNRFEEEYKSIINTKDMTDQELEFTLREMDYFYDKLIKLNVTEDEINNFIQRCISLSI